MESIITRPNKTVINGQLEQQFEEIKERIKLNAQDNGRKNQPQPSNRKLDSFFREYHLAYQGLIHNVGRELLFKSSVDEVVKHKAATDARLREVHNKRLDLQEKHIALSAASKANKPPYRAIRVWAVWATIACLTSFDALLSYGVWVTFGFSVITALFATALFSVVLLTLAHFFDKMVLWGKTHLQRRLIAGVIIAMLTAVFTFMAFHRSAYLEQQMANSGLQNFRISPVPFIVLSLLLFMVAVAVKVFAYPSDEQRSQYREHQRCKRALKENEAAQQKLREEQESLEQQHAEVRQVNVNKLEYGSLVESAIISRAHQGFEEFKKHNLNARPDNTRPLSFDEEYPFQFETHFASIKQL